MTVIKKRMPIVKAALRNFFLFIVKFVELIKDEVSSAVTSRIIALIASSKLISEKVKGGSCKVYLSSI